MAVLTGRRRVERLRDGVRTSSPDDIAAEEPLELRVGGAPATVTMRTPGHDTDLMLGWLVSEGSVVSADQVLGVRERSSGEGLEHATSVDVALRDPASAPTPRAYPTTSSCGICGANGIDAVRTRSVFDVTTDDAVVTSSVLAMLPDLLRSRQTAFERSGGLHAAGLFSVTGDVLVVREDVGRHNAVDKVIGWALREGKLPLRGHVLQVSGRASFELVQKAVMAGIPVLSAVSAPSTMAVDLAEHLGVTVVGFVRSGGMNVYTHGHRVV